MALHRTRLALNSLAGVLLLASCNGAGAVCSTTDALCGGAAESLTKTVGDGQRASVGMAVPIAPQVTVRDPIGSPVNGVSVTFAVSGGRGKVTGSPVTSNAAGVATVGSWTLGAQAGANTLTASVGSLPAVTFTATGEKR